jgi:Fe-S-cluster-containing dehydrogenase component
MKTLVIDAGRCIDCKDCQLACKDEHCDNDWSPIAAPQGPGQFWIRIENEEAGSGSRVKMRRLPVTCQQCAEPKCLAACKHQAIYKRADGIVIIDPELCAGCGDCQEACGLGVIFRNSVSGISQKCTLCAHLLDAGREPRCTGACPSGALAWVEEAELCEQLVRAPFEQPCPELGESARLRYMNLPKPFIAGDVCSADESECVAGVQVSAVHQITGQRYEAETDFLGGFCLDNVQPGYYTIMFAKQGYTSKRLSNTAVPNTAASPNLAAVRLHKQQ